MTEETPRQTSEQVRLRVAGANHRVCKGKHPPAAFPFHCEERLLGMELFLVAGGQGWAQGPAADTRQRTGPRVPRHTEGLLLLTREHAHRNPPGQLPGVGPGHPGKSEGEFICRWQGRPDSTPSGCQPSAECGARGRRLSSLGRSLPQRGTGGFGPP